MNNKDCHKKDKIYKKAIEKINHDEKYKLCCGQIIGPTGPTGPQGPATITVGTTTTLNPGTEASVTNNGSFENVVLDFSIPMGLTGPQGKIGPTGPQGEIGPTGPTGPSSLRSAYLVTFNPGTDIQGISIPVNSRLPIDRAELDITNIVTLDNGEKAIKFNNAGYYRIEIIASAYSLKTDTTFDPNKDFITIAFRQTGTDNIYIGGSLWTNDNVAKQIKMVGVIAVANPNNEYELVNVGNQTIYLNSPDIKNISSQSYFTNPLLTINIEYLGRQN